MIKRQKVRKSVADVNGTNMQKNPTKFFLNLEKQKAINTTVRHLIDNDKDITDLKAINACICKFSKDLFKMNVSK